MSPNGRSPSNDLTAVVTGAAGGIGLSLSRLLSERGYRLHAVDVNNEALSSLDSELNPETLSAGSVAESTTLQELADQVGAVDLLCLNAGVVSSEMGSPWSASSEEWDRVLGVNLLGVVNGLRSFVPLMLERKKPSNILITASLAGVATWPGGGPYAASKHAVLAVAEQAGLELADTHVGVTVLCPALVRTGMSEHGADADDVALGALDAVADGQFAVIPEEWAEAARVRAENLVQGSAPELPGPS